MRMRQGAPGVICSAVTNPSRIQRYRVVLATPRICSAAVMVTTTTSSQSGPTSGIGNW